jgi:hypothetical protein
MHLFGAIENKYSELEKKMQRAKFVIIQGDKLKFKFFLCQKSTNKVDAFFLL